MTGARKKRQILRLHIFTFQMTVTGGGKTWQLFSFITTSLSWWTKLEKCDKFFSSNFYFHRDRSWKSDNCFVFTLFVSQWPKLEKATNVLSQHFHIYEDQGLSSNKLQALTRISLFPRAGNYFDFIWGMYTKILNMWWFHNAKSEWYLQKEAWLITLHCYWHTLSLSRWPEIVLQRPEPKDK